MYKHSGWCVTLISHDVSQPSSALNFSMPTRALSTTDVGRLWRVVCQEESPSRLGLWCRVSFHCQILNTFMKMWNSNIFGFIPCFVFFLFCFVCKTSSLTFYLQNKISDGSKSVYWKPTLPGCVWVWRWRRCAYEVAAISDSISGVSVQQLRQHYIKQWYEPLSFNGRESTVWNDDDYKDVALQFSGSRFCRSSKFFELHTHPRSTAK